MIWGETTEQKYARLTELTKRPWFAWRPVVLRDGRWAWLSTITRRRVAGFDWWIYEIRALPASQPNQGGEDEPR